MYTQTRKDLVDKLNAELEIENSKLRNILKNALSRDTYFDFDSLKQTPRIVPFKRKKPELREFLPIPPSGLNKMLPWKKSEYERSYEQGEERYKRAERKYQKAKEDYEYRMNGLREEASEHNRKIETLKENFAAGRPEDVKNYFNRVLHARDYPEVFPHKWEFAYVPDSRQLVIEYDLPAFQATPEAKSYRYVKSRDETTQTRMPQLQRKQLYASVLAQIPLRIIHEVYTADRTEKVDTIIFNGYVKTIDPSTGKPGQFCLVAVSTTRHQFLDLNLTMVDPQECIKGLQGRFSRKPETLVSVDPMEPICDDSTPVSLPKKLVREHETRRDEIYHLVSTEIPVGRAKDITIPARNPQSRASSSISPKGAHFVELAKKYADRTVSHAEPAPFQEYWPSYESMDEAQQQWYFYWRAQLRQGNRLPTALSYLFVHIYEAINLTGFESPQEGFRYLDEFWRYYRQLQPRLDRYLPDWIADFIVLHELAPNVLGWYSEVSKVTNATDQDFAIEAWVGSGGDFEALSNEIIFELANYNPTKSKFYKQHTESIHLDLAYKKALQAVDDATRKEQGKSLFQIHQPEHRRSIRRAPFESAVHAYPRTEIEIASVHFWSNVAPLGTMLNSIVKYADNILREQAGYKYRVRGIQLTQKYRSTIDSALRLKAQKQELSIDYSRIAQLSKDSEALRARLLAVEDAESEEQETVETSLDERLVAAASWVPGSADMTLVPAEANVKKLTPIDWFKIGQRRKARAEILSRLITKNGSAKYKQKPVQEAEPTIETTTTVATIYVEDTVAHPPAAGFLHRPEGTPDDLLTDLAEIARIMGDGESKASKLIGVMMKNGWECPADLIERGFPGEFINVIIDEINSIALDELGDTLIFEEDGLSIILEEYRDEIKYILLHPEYLEA